MIFAHVLACTLTQIIIRKSLYPRQHSEYWDRFSCFYIRRRFCDVHWLMLAGMRRIVPTGDAKTTTKMVLIGASMMVVIDLFVLGGWRYIWPDKARMLQPAVQVVEVIPQMQPVFIIPEEIAEAEIEPEEEAPVPVLAPWQKNAVVYAKPDWAKGQVVIIIDDLGLDRKRSARIVDLPGPLTLAYLPYAKRLHAQTRNARSMGHELLIHTPMEPMSDTADPGPNALLEGLGADEIRKRLTGVLDSFDGYVGINNHMGSRLTSNPEIMGVVMDMLRERGMAFVDSKTIQSSVAGQVARDKGLAYAERDVFLDHEGTPEFVAGALVRLEKLALRDGVAIAIGHPKDVTLDALVEWLPTLEGKGLSLAPVSAVLVRP